MAFIVNIFIATPATQVSEERQFPLVEFVSTLLHAMLREFIFGDNLFYKANQIDFSKKFCRKNIDFFVLFHISSDALINAKCGAKWQNY